MVVAAAPAVAAPAVAAPAVVATKAAEGHAMVPQVPYSYLPYATAYGYQAAPVATVNAAPVAAVHAAPVTVQAAPVAVSTANVAVHSAPVAVHSAPVAVHAAPVAVAAAPAVVAPALTGSQYHSQDDVGQYSFGYNDLNSVRQEVKTIDGAVKGAYQYVDTNGLVQTVQYIADEAGFRVAGTNLPVFGAAVPADTPEVAAAKAQHIQALAVAEANAIKADAEAYVAAAPIVAAPAPVVAAPAPVASVNAAPITFPAANALPALAEGYYGAATAHSTGVDGAADALAEGYYGAASIAANGASVYAAAPAYGVHSAPVAVASVAPVAIASADPTVYAVAAPTPVAVAAPAAPLPVAHAAPVVAQAAPVAVAAAVAPETGFQYHSQDDFGQYSFGYSDGNSGKQEIKTADGVIRGSYSYVDSDGIVQTVNYIADALGFRVGATNLPVHHVDAAVAEEAPVVAAAAIPEETPVVAAAYDATHSHSVMTPQVAYSYLPYAVNYGYHNVPAAPVVPAYQQVAVAAPVTSQVAAAPVVAAYKQAPVAQVAAAPVVAAPVAAAAPVPIVASAAAPVSSQFHAQDEAGSYSYGYNSDTQAKVSLIYPLNIKI